MTVERHGTIVVDKFYLVKGYYGTLLGFQTASDLGVVKITQNVSTSRETVEGKYPGIYAGIGKLKQQTVK